MADDAALEQQLLQGVARGDEQAFVTLVETHHASLSRFIRCYLRDEQDLQDCIQDTLIAVLENAHTFEGRSSVRTWILGIARFKALRRIQKRSRSREDASDLSLLGEKAGWGASHVEAAYELGQVIEALESLPSQTSEIIILRDVEGLTTSEAADMLGISNAAAKSRLHRARLELMASLEPRRSR